MSWNVYCEIKGRYDRMQEEIAALFGQRSSLGLFSRKKKKEIDERIRTLTDARDRLAVRLKEELTALEPEVFSQVEQTLRGSGRLAGYEIRKNVSPAVCGADEVLRRRYDIDRQQALYGWKEPFSADRYGRPLSFLIEKNGRPCLGIMIAKSSSFSHWLVKWAQHWCEDQGIPYLRLHVGMENSPSYVLERVCGLLGTEDGDESLEPSEYRRYL